MGIRDPILSTTQRFWGYFFQAILRWFETAIGRSNAIVNIIVTGLQVHAERFYDSSKVEGWDGLI